jgi:uncharacterized protein (DUF2147 family)
MPHSIELEAMKTVAIGVAISLLLTAMPPAQAADPSPVGRWVTYSDRTHKPTGVIEIRIDHGALLGTVLEQFNRSASLPPAICRKCEGPSKNAPIIGMTIMWGLTNQGGAVWDNGSILDPNSGDVYSAKVELEDGGQKLLVRGYFGISLLGRSQEWIRQN